MPDQDSVLTVNKRIIDLNTTAAGVNRATLKVPVFNPATNKTEQTPLTAPAGAVSSNDVRGGEKFVDFVDSRYFGVPATALTLDRVDPETLVVGNWATVNNPAKNPTQVSEPAKRFRLARTQSFSPNTVLAYVNGGATTSRASCEWAAEGSAEAAAATIPFFDDEADEVRVGTTVKFLDGRDLLLYDAAVNMRRDQFPSDRLPIPTRANSVYWRQVSATPYQHPQNTDSGTNNDFFEVGQSELVDATGAYYRGIIVNKSEGSGKGFFGAKVQDENGQPCFERVKCANWVSGSASNVYEPDGGGGVTDWTSGPQKKGAFVLWQGEVYLVLRDMLNSLSPPSGNPANYKRVGGVLAGSVGRAELSEAVNNELDGLATDVQSSQFDISALTGRTTALEDSLAANEPDGRGLTITFEVAANQTRGTYTTFGNQDGGVFSSFSSTNCSSVLLRQDPVAGTTIFQSSGTRGAIATPVEASNSALQVEVVKLVAGQPATVTLYRDQPAAPAFFAASQAGVMTSGRTLGQAASSNFGTVTCNANATLMADYVLRPHARLFGNGHQLNLNGRVLFLASPSTVRDALISNGTVQPYGQSGCRVDGGTFSSAVINGTGGGQTVNLYGTRIECPSGFVLLTEAVTVNWYGTIDYPTPVLPTGADVSGGTVNIVPYAGGGGGGGADLSNYYNKQQSDDRYALKGTGGGGSAPPAGYTGLVAPKTYLCWASVSSYGNGFPDGTWLTSGGAWYNDEHRTSVHTSEFYGTRSTPNQLGMVGDTGAMTARTKGEIFARGFQLFWANTGDSPSFTLNVRRASDNAVIKSLVVPPSAVAHHAGGADMITAPTSIVLDAPAVCYLEIAKNAGGILPVSKAVAF